MIKLTPKRFEILKSTVNEFALNDKYIKEHCDCYHKEHNIRAFKIACGIVGTLVCAHYDKQNPRFYTIKKGDDFKDVFLTPKHFVTINLTAIRMAVINHWIYYCSLDEKYL